MADFRDGAGDLRGAVSGTLDIVAVVISEILPMVELIILIEPTASWVRDLQRADAVDRFDSVDNFRHVADQLREAAILATVAAKERRTRVRGLAVGTGAC
jgi:hypothetical protein